MAQRSTIHLGGPCRIFAPSSEEIDAWGVSSTESVSVQFRSGVSTFLAAWGTPTSAFPRTSPIDDIQKRCLVAIRRFVGELSDNLQAFLRQRAFEGAQEGTFVSAVSMEKKATPPGSGEFCENEHLSGIFSNAATVWDGFRQCDAVAMLRDMWEKVARRAFEAAHSNNFEAMLDLVGTLPQMQPFLHALFGLECGLVHICTWLQADIVKHLSTIASAAAHAALNLPLVFAEELDGSKVRAGLKRRGANIRQPLAVTAMILLHEALAAMPNFTTTTEVFDTDKALEELNGSIFHLLSAAEAHLGPRAKAVFESSRGSAAAPLLVHALQTHLCLLQLVRATHEDSESDGD